MLRRLLLACVSSALAVGCDSPSITIEAVSGRGLWEGRGCSPAGCDGACTVDGCPGGRRPPIVMVTTSGRIDAARAHLIGSEVPVTVDLLAAGPEVAALAVRVPVSAALPLGNLPLVIEVDGADGGSASTEGDPLLALEVLGLDELVLTGPLPPASATALYSSIVVPTAIVAQLDGDIAVRLSAASDIELAGVLSVDAGDRAPGPGGCAGMASAEDPRGCPPGDGAGADDGDAGAGSFGSAGGGGALAGETTGNPMIVPVGAFAPPGVPMTKDHDNRGHGGGAHADDRGGHGGGGVVLTASGRITFGQFARVTARGGAPAASKGGSGGGGSGGAIVVSAAAGLEVNAAAPMPFEATGGGEGAVRGGDGRIRLDGLVGDGVPPSTPGAWRGPAWNPAPLVVTGETPLTLHIDPRWSEEIRFLIEGRGTPVMCTPSAGTCALSVTPDVGATSVCAALRPGFTPPPGLAENGTCIELVRVE